MTQRGWTVVNRLITQKVAKAGDLVAAALLETCRYRLRISRQGHPWRDCTQEPPSEIRSVTQGSLRKRGGAGESGGQSLQIRPLCAPPDQLPKPVLDVKFADGFEVAANPAISP